MAQIYRSKFQLAIEFAFIASLAFMPFYFGGERIMAWGATGVAQSLIALALIFPSRSKIERDPKEIRILSISATGLLCVFSWAIIQIAPIHLSDFSHPIWFMAADALDEPVSGRISVSPDEGFLTLVKAAIVILTCLNATVIYGRNQDPYRCLSAIAMIATAYAVLGMIWLRFYPDGHIWLETSPYKPSLVSTFVNRNTFAQYLGIASLCALTIIIYKWRKSTVNIRTRSKIYVFLKEALPLFAGFSTLFAILFISILMTGSRAGLLTVCAAYPVLFISVIKFSKFRFIASISLIGIVIGICFILYDAYSSYFLNRTITIVEDYSARNGLYEEVWALILQRPLLGYGLGSFESAFRARRSVDFDLYGTWLRAHNVYFDVISALGLPAAGIAFLLVLTPLFIHIRRTIRRPMSTLSVFIFALYIELLLHSLFDFGLQSGANAITVSAILGAALTEPKRSRPINQ